MEQSTALRREASRLGLCFLAFVLVTQTVQLLLSVLLLYCFPQFAAKPAATWLMSYLPLYGIGLPVLLLLFKTIPAEHTAVPSSEKLSIPKLFQYFLLCLGATYIFNFISLAISVGFTALTGSPMPNPVLQVTSGNSPIAVFFFLCVLPPLGEEFICRKLIWNRIGAFGTRVYVVVSALIFALIHGNFSQFFYAFALGALFAYIYAHTGRLIYTILLHFGINLVGTVIAPAAISLLGEAGNLVLGIFVIVCIAGAVILWLRREFWLFGKDPSASEFRVRDALTAPGMIAMIVILLLLCFVSLFAYL